MLKGGGVLTPTSFCALPWEGFPSLDVGATMRSRGLTREPVCYNVRLGCVVPTSLGEEAQWREHLTYGLRSRKAYSVGFVSSQIVLAALMVPSGFESHLGLGQG